ncbi:MAG: hypothetical protein N4A35_07495 [Flavobacteriales bacterium]|jgi:hypothetical protein|nr:hypothetical protein [Flavobacteriales bacterium]
MVLIKTGIVVIALFAVSISWGQKAERVHTNEPSRNIKKADQLVKLNSLYFEEVAVLKTYFTSGEIKNGFPGYNHSLSKASNALELKKWIAVGENKAALTKDGIIAIENYITGK